MLEDEIFMIRNIFHLVLKVLIFLYRVTGGKFGGHVQGLQVLLLTTTGRKTGKKRTTPLGYFIENGNYVITASNAGFDTHPAWFHNLRTNPRVQIEVQNQEMQAEADIASAEKRTSLWSKLISLSPAYGNYSRKTSREIPMVILRPLKNA
jgi:deazaflavin-dependent oxidoreductase (nitroreductase family)